MNKCQNNLHKNICTKKFYVSHFVVAVDNKQFPYEKQRVGVWALCEWAWLAGWLTGWLPRWLTGCLAGFCGCQRVYQLKRRLINIKPNAIRRPHNLQLFVSPRLSLHLSLTLQPFALCPLSHGIAPPPIQSLNPSKLSAYVCVCAWVLRFGFIQKLKLNFNIFLFAFHLRNSLSQKNTRPQFTQFHTPHLSGAYKDSTILCFFG